MNKSHCILEHNFVQEIMLMCDFFIYYLVVYGVLGEGPHATVLFQRQENNSLEIKNPLAVLPAPSWTFPHVVL